MSGIGIGIGLGIGLGLGGGGYRGAAWLAAKVQAIVTSGIVGLYIGDDIPDASGNVTSWPGRVGTTLTNEGTDRFSVGTINGRKAINQTVSSTACLAAASTGVITTMVTVATRPTVVWPTYGTSPLLKCRDDGAGTALTVLNAGTTFYSITGWSHYVDGSASEADIPSGSHVFEGASAGVTATKIATGISSEATGWVGPRAFILAGTVALSSGQRSALVSLLQQYYRLT